MSVWSEAFFGPNVSDLKKLVIKLKYELECGVNGWFKRRKLRKQISDILEEIEYQEGRIQYANRPYSFPTMTKCTGDIMNCGCGCWKTVRVKQFGL